MSANLKRLFFGLACLALLMALFYAEEDWRGWHAWHKFKRTWEAKGVRFDRSSVIPPSVPDDQNFALTPIVASSYEMYFDGAGHELNPRDTSVVNRLQMKFVHNNDSPADGGQWQKSTLSDLGVWQQYYRAQAVKTNDFPVAPRPQSTAADVLLALSKYDAGIEELREAGRLPDSRFPLAYDRDFPPGLLLPHLGSLKGCAQVLQLRARAELQDGRSEKALADLKLMLRLVDSVRTEPVLISHLVRIAIVQLAIQAVWEGLARHQWSDAQLAELEPELARLDFLADYKLTMRGELVFFQGGTFDYLRRHPGRLFDLADDRPRASLPGRMLSRLIPSGWFYQNQLRCARPMVEFYLPVADTNQGTIFPAAVHQADARVKAETRHHTAFNLMERLFLPALGNAAKRFAAGQAAVDLARTAMALERYRFARGNYPGSLDALAPQFLAQIPHDVINGQPLQYRPGAYGQFVLYSVGWNEKDDDGEIGPTKNGNVDIEKGDWVWRYPAR